MSGTDHDAAELRAAFAIMYQGITGTPVPPILSRDELDAELSDTLEEVREWMNTPNPDPDLEIVRLKLRRGSQRD